MTDGPRGIEPPLRNDPPKSPWGGKAEDGEDGAGGPRNPWSVPPQNPRPRHGAQSTIDELLRRARGGGNGGGSGGGGFGGGPLGSLGGRNLWVIGVSLIVGLWVIFTSFHTIAPQERGVVTFFGKFAGTLEPGVRLTMPAPINSVIVEDVQNIRTDNFPEEGGGENPMLTGDQNIVDLSYSVRWDIVNLQDYIFQIRDPKATVRATAESAMREVISSVTLDQVLGGGKTAIEGRVAERMQQILDDYKAGVRIQGVAISKADPPSAVIDDFKAVTAAQQEAVANLNNARAYAQQVIARAQGEAAQFDKVYEQYRLSPEVTKRRMYYETMEAVLAKSNKTIVEAPGVTPYLPLPTPKRLIEPDQTTPPAVQQGGQ